MSNLKRRMNLWKENPYCFVCEKEIEDFSETSLEHIRPISKGGSNKKENLAVSHRECNELKGKLLKREDWQEKLQQKEIETQLILWKKFRTDHFVKTLIEKSFGDLVFIANSLGKFPNYYLRTKIPKDEIQLQIRYIQRLRKRQDLERIIEESKYIDIYRTQPYWKIVFGILFLDHYIRTKEIDAFLHSYWRLKTFRGYFPSLILYQYADTLLDLCNAYEPEVCKKVAGTF